MMTQTEMLEEIKRAAAEEWSELYEFEKYLGANDNYTERVHHAACVLVKLLENLTGEQWYYCSSTGEMKPE